MKQMLNCLLLIFILTSPTWGFGSATVDSPQEQMVGARFHSLGWSNPLIMGDAGGTLANPATLGEIDSIPLIMSSHKVLDQFDYRYFATAIPFYMKLPFSEKTEVNNVLP